MNGALMVPVGSNCKFFVVKSPVWKRPPTMVLCLGSCQICCSSTEEISSMLRYPGGENSFFEVVVRPLARVGPIERFQGVGAVYEGTKLRALFCPGAATQILGAGGDAQVIALE